MKLKGMPNMKMIHVHKYILYPNKIKYHGISCYHMSMSQGMGLYVILPVINTCIPF